MWAYHSTSDVDPDIPQIFGCPELQHTARGYQKITFIAATATIETTSTPKVGQLKQITLYLSICFIKFYPRGSGQS